MGKISLPTCLWCGAIFQPSGYAGHCSRKCQHEAELVEAPIRAAKADREAAKRLAQLEAERARYRELVAEYKGKIQAQGEDEVFKEFPAVFRFFNWPTIIGALAGWYLFFGIVGIIIVGPIMVLWLGVLQLPKTQAGLILFGGLALWSIFYYANKRQRLRAFEEAKEELQQG